MVYALRDLEERTIHYAAIMIAWAVETYRDKCPEISSHLSEFSRGSRTGREKLLLNYEAK
jgi:hypothetical protein